MEQANLKKILHRKSAKERRGFAAMLYKGPQAGRATVSAASAYFKHWDKKHKGMESMDQEADYEIECAALTNHYYDLATDMYEYGWGQSFHFCRFAKGERFKEAISRHEKYLAEVIGIQKGMEVLDVGCGVGGPAREIAKATGATVTGLNINEYQIARATKYAAKAGVLGQVNFVQGDFMQMPFASNSFDAVYAMDATVHAPTLKGVYSEIFRVLKPGGIFGVYEWVMTDKYDDNNAEHQEIRLGIEQGNGVSKMHGRSVALSDMKGAGFQLLRDEDLADSADTLPWFWPISGKIRGIQSPKDVFTIVRMTHAGRTVIHSLLSLLETMRVVPQGTKKTADCLALAADSLVKAGSNQLFTPMYLMVGCKPDLA